MTNNIKVFENQEFGSVRTIIIEGEPWFVGKDVAKALGYSNPHDALAKHVREDEKQPLAIRDPLGKLRDTIIINESGFYSLVFASKLPTAQEFRYWVTSEVLPDIRKHGMYMTDSLAASVLDNPEVVANVLLAYAEEKKKRIQTEVENEILKPKATYCDTVLQAPTAVPISIIVKDYGMSATQMNKLLHDFHVQYKVNGTWLLYQEYADCGYVKTSSHVYEKNDGTTDCKVYTKWTQVGRMFIYEVLKANNIHPVMEQNGGDSNAKKPRKFYPHSVQ